jgi:hypothetical protein
MFWMPILKFSLRIYLNSLFKKGFQKNALIRTRRFQRKTVEFGIYSNGLATKIRSSEFTFDKKQSQFLRIMKGMKKYSY